MTKEKPLSEKECKLQGYEGNILFHKEDVKEAVERLKKVKRQWADMAVCCPICDEARRLWVYGKSHCYNCEIDKIFGEFK